MCKYCRAIFEINGEFVKTYKLEKGEKLIFKNEEQLIIKSASKSYDFLYQKLCIYGKFCKVIAPLDLKKYFLKIFNQILNLY